MNRGYSGYYKNIFLRSSYEYAYAKYLDFNNLEWRYEEENFEIDGELYKPDFFIYQNNVLMKIIEIKSDVEEELKKGRKRVKGLQSKIGIKCELITYEQLKKIYKNMPYTLNSTITEWKNSEHTTIQKVWNGEKNPHYGMKHSEETKKLIGLKTKQRWEEDGETKKKMIEGLRKSGLSQKGKLKKAREIRNCLICDKTFEVIKDHDNKFCSRGCAFVHNANLGTKVYVENREKIHQEIKKYIDEWVICNKELVLSTPMNRIKTSLQPLLNEIEKKYQVKDFRVISKSVFGEDCGRKELLKYMKEIVQ